MTLSPMRSSLAPLVLGALLALGGCAHKPVEQPANAAATPVAANSGAQTNGANGANATGANLGAASGDDVAGPQEGILAQRVVYFDFDSSEIKGAGVALVEAHARYLVAHPNAHVRLEGNTDDRGSHEYNIGLGERRAQAVKRAMLLQGVTERQLDTVSYGAERPAVAGSDDAAWAKNRRTEINYVQ